MIKKNELRIGNKVMHGDVVFYVTQLFKGVAYLEHIEGGFGAHEYRNIDPIPLTPEILEKAGFEKVGRYAIGAGGYHIYANGRIEFLIPQKGDPFILSFYETKVESVHQLQNIYFALTGTELEIKL